MNSGVHYLQREKLQSLINLLITSGYRCIGPQVHNDTIIFETLTNVDQLPRGIVDIQSPGNYRLEKHNHSRYFDWNNGPQAIKPIVFMPHEELWSSSKEKDGSITFKESTTAHEKLAIIGIRACDIAALYLQDKHFLHDQRKDPYYLAHRQDLLLIAVNCTRSGSTCFCASTGDGPKVHYGYDISITELDEGYTLDSLSDAGYDILQQLETMPASTEHKLLAENKIINAIEQQTRKLPSQNLKKLLFGNLVSPLWNDIAKRCLSCGNCTSVCPTCFCHSELEIPELDGGQSHHARQWDSCFTAEHSYIHGITIRADTSQRFRQWLTHKFGSWHEQYGRSGCVGCGRCITWCPVEIDVTEEINKLVDAGGK